MIHLIEAIERYRVNRGLSGADLARLLGIDRSTWSKIKHEQKPPGGRFLSAVMREIPSLRFEVEEYMIRGPND